MLDRLRALFSYPSGEKRATGYLDGFDDLCSLLMVSFGVRPTLVAFQAYADGTVGCDWHADSPFGWQAILSLGASRRLGLRPVGGSDRPIVLHAGDLLVMPDGFQDEWEHCIPPDPTVADERCSLVFRTPRGD